MRRSSRQRTVLGAVGSVVAGTLVGLGSSALLNAAGVRVSAWFCVVLAVTGLGLLVLVKGLLSELETPLPAVHGQAARGEPPRDVLAPLERRLAAAGRERRLYLSGMQPLLHGLARERLRLHHTLDLDRALEHDPDLARRTLGDELWHWLTTTDRDGPPPTPQQLHRVITAIEQL